jgi:hypothetical protein
VVVHRGGTIKKGRLINVTRCRVAGSDVSVARAANLHQATVDYDTKPKDASMKTWQMLFQNGPDGCPRSFLDVDRRQEEKCTVILTRYMR